jgi:hypothetical protein
LSPIALWPAMNLSRSSRAAGPRPPRAASPRRGAPRARGR